MDASQPVNFAVSVGFFLMDERRFPKCFFPRRANP
jgi:hypothetical protein